MKKLALLSILLLAGPGCGVFLDRSGSGAAPPGPVGASPQATDGTVAPKNGGGPKGGGETEDAAKEAGPAVEIVIEAETSAVEGVLDKAEEGGRAYLVASANFKKDAGPAVYVFEVPEGLYTISALVKPEAPGKGDSFLAALDDGEAQRFSTGSGTEWAWLPVPVTAKPKIPLAAGKHELRISPREKGARIDQIKVKRVGAAPMKESEPEKTE